MPDLDVHITVDEIAVALHDLTPTVSAVNAPALYARLGHRHPVSDIDGLEEFTLPAGAVLNGQRLLMLQNGEAVHFDPSDEANADKVLGFSTHAAEQGAAVTIRRMGLLSSVVLTPGAVYYAATDGLVTATVPTSGILLRVGVAKDAETLIVDLGTSIIIHTS